MYVRSREPRICRAFSNKYVRPALLVLTSVFLKKKKKKSEAGRGLYFVQKSPGFAESLQIYLLGQQSQ